MLLLFNLGYEWNITVNLEVAGFLVLFKASMKLLALLCWTYTRGLGPARYALRKTHC